MPRNRWKDKAFPVGLFIMLSLIVLIGGIAWLRNFTVRPAYSFIATFDNPGRVIAGYPVYYRGINVGRVVSAKLSPDHQQAYVQIGISDKTVSFHNNIQVHIKEEGFTGQRFIALDPPLSGDNDSGSIIHNGDKIAGVPSGGWDKVQDLIASLTQNNRLEKLIDTTQTAMKDLTVATQSLNHFSMDAGHFLNDNKQSIPQTLTEVNRAARAIEHLSTGLDGFLSDTQQQIHTTLPKISKISGSIQHIDQNTQGIPNIIDTVNQTAQGVQQTAQTINAQLLQTNLIPNLNNTVNSFNTMLGSPNSVSAPASTKPLSPQATVNLKTSLIEAGHTFQRLNCVTAQANQVLSQRFLGFKLFFGKPGNGFNCNQDLTQR